VISSSSRLQKELLSLAYFAMRLGIFAFSVLLLSADLAFSETPKAGSPSPSPHPEAARGPASVDRKPLHKFADQHDRYRRPGQERDKRKPP